MSLRDTSAKPARTDPPPLPENPLGEAIQHASIDEIRDLQTRRLAWTLAHVYGNVSHYRESFDAIGVHPDDFKSLEDLRHFPLTTKQTLRDHYPFGMFAVPREQVVQIHASSGTTGKPTVVGYTTNDIDRWTDAMARSIEAAGGKPGDIVHVAYGYGLFTGGLGAHYGAERLGCTVVPMSGGQTARQVELIRDFRPDIIMVTPSYLLAIADEFARHGLTARDCSLRIGILGAEPWTEEMRREIETTLGMDAVDIYGLSEVMGPGVAQECVETKDGLTVWEDYFYPEIIDPVTGAPVAAGDEGELVFTSLTKEALPVVRYRTRDLTRLLPGTARSMRRIGKILGRSDDMLIIHGVNVFPSQIEEIICSDERLAPHFLLEIDRRGRLDELTVRAEARRDAADAETRARTAADLRRRIKSSVGITTVVDVGAPDSLERSQGKAVRVLDRRM